MLKIFYLLLLDLLVFIISVEINQWKVVENILLNTTERNATSLTFISSSSNSNYFYTYKNNSKVYIYSTKIKYSWDNVDANLSPISINLDNQVYLIFSENGNKFYYLIKKFNILNSMEIKDDSDIARLKGFKL